MGVRETCRSLSNLAGIRQCLFSTGPGESVTEIVCGVAFAPEVNMHESVEYELL